MERTPTTVLSAMTNDELRDLVISRERYVEELGSRLDAVKNDADSVTRDMARQIAALTDDQSKLLQCLDGVRVGPINLVYSAHRGPSGGIVATAMPVWEAISRGIPIDTLSSSQAHALAQVE